MVRRLARFLLAFALVAFGVGRSAPARAEDARWQDPNDERFRELRDEQLRRPRGLIRFSSQPEDSDGRQRAWIALGITVGIVGAFVFANRDAARREQERMKRLELEQRMKKVFD